MNTGKASVGRRMLCACIMGYGIGVMQSAGLPDTPVATVLCFILGSGFTLGAWLYDWNRDRSRS